MTTQTKTLNDLPDLEQPVREMLESKRETRPCRSNRASALGHPCTRFLYYCRAEWQERKIPELTLQYIFGEGNVHEEEVFARLKKAGWEISNQQRDFEDAELEITGHVDGFVHVEYDLYPLEIKSMSSMIWPTINSIEDMLNSNRTWIRAYPAQLNLYMYLASKDYGVFYLKNKQTGEGKSIWLALDYGLAEECLQKAEAVNAALSTGTVPDRIKYDPDVCEKCDFEHICLPPGEAREGLLIEHEPEIAELLDRRSELEANSKEFSAIDKKIKDYIKSRDSEMLNIGDYLITKKISTYTTKPTEAEEKTRTTIKIQKLGAVEEEG